MFAYEDGEGFSEVKCVRIRNWHFFKLDKHLGKMRIYTYTRNKPNVSFTLSFISFVVYKPLFHFCFAVEQNIVQKYFLLTSLSLNTRERLLMKSKNSVSVLLNMPNITVQKFKWYRWRLFSSLKHHIEQWKGIYFIVVCFTNCNTIFDGLFAQILDTDNNTRQGVK